MIKLFLPRQKVPEWLQRQEAQKGFERHSERACIKFTSIVLVWAWRGSYRVVNIIPKSTHMSINGGKYVTVHGQSPSGGNGNVIHYRSLLGALGF